MIVSVGRIIMVVVNDVRDVRPAIVTHVYKPASAGTVNCHVFKDPLDQPGELINAKTSQSIGVGCLFDADGGIGTWHWPPRI